MRRHFYTGLLMVVMMVLAGRAYSAGWLVNTQPDTMELISREYLVPQVTRPGDVVAQYQHFDQEKLADCPRPCTRSDQLSVGGVGSTRAPLNGSRWPIGDSGLELEVSYNMARSWGNSFPFLLGSPETPFLLSGNNGSFLSRTGITNTIYRGHGRVIPGTYSVPRLTVSVSEVPGGSSFSKYIGVQQFIIRAPSCNVAVDRPATFSSPVGAWEFEGIGSTAGTASASIKVECSVASNATITWTAGSTVRNDPNIIALTKGGAEGYGVVLYEGNEKIELGKARPLDVPEEGQTFDVTAKYIKTSNDTKAGRADATVTVTAS